ncbi:MAG: helix-turn-helix domain-containing protein [Amaricoccus sp.]|uniref:helix-turn-helix domain-containing protein n=1 Tax=Amaricoccus sp. TaxID=1872485 RepID=UPI0039E2CBAD
MFEKARASGFRRIEDARIQRAVVLIESRMGQDVTLDTVARHVGLGGRQLTRLFRDNLGVTPKRFIIETRLRCAHWLVLHSSLSMTEIAYQTGFADCAHFATSFKARYGAPPSSLRRSGGAGVSGGADEALARGE